MRLRVVAGTPEGFRTYQRNTFPTELLQRSYIVAVLYLLLASLTCTWITAAFWHFSSLLSWSILRIDHCRELITQSSCAQPSLRWHSPCHGNCRPARLAWDFCIPHVIYLPHSTITSHLIWILEKSYNLLSSLCASRYATSAVQSSLGRNPYSPLSPEGIYNLLNTFGFLFCLKGPLGTTEVGLRWIGRTGDRSGIGKSHLQVTWDA